MRFREAGSRQSLAAFAAVGALLYLWWRTVRPLNAVLAAVNELSGTGRDVQVPVTGSAQVRELARAFNAQIGENGRLLNEAVGLLAEQARNDRLRKMARAVGDPLTPDGVVREACSALTETGDAEGTYLHLLDEDRVLPSACRQHGPLPDGAFRGALPGKALRGMAELLSNQASLVVNDVRSAEGGRLLADWPALPLRSAGVTALLITPFGVGATPLGFIAVCRFRPGPPWRPAEVDAVESIAADLGRGLHHARLYEAEQHLVRDLKSLDQAKSDFLATVSHELRAPLTSIEGYAEMLSDPETGSLSPPQREMLQTVRRNTSRLRNLIDDVFTLATLECGAFTAATEPVNLAEVIAGVVDTVRPSAAEHKLTLAVKLADGDVAVNGDARQLDRVFLNLLTNAVKFTPEGGQIQVALSTEPGSVVARVSDTGIGIPREERKELFNRFFRASNARQLGIPGTGLGLAIVRSIVTGHGGEVTVSPGAEAGTTFRVRLPRRPGTG
jgi:two-component system, OmpR family, phosphate regulon sensor histidine kinase PhoR